MINKNNKKVILKSIGLLALAFLIMPNIYFVAGKLGITLAPE